MLVALPELGDTGMRAGSSDHRNGIEAYHIHLLTYRKCFAPVLEIKVVPIDFATVTASGHARP